jgi:hypothetical protein
MCPILGGLTMDSVLLSRLAAGTPPLMRKEQYIIGESFLPSLSAGRIIVKLVDLLSISTGDWLIQCYMPLCH